MRRLEKLFPNLGPWSKEDEPEEKPLPSHDRKHPKTLVLLQTNSTCDCGATYKEPEAVMLHYETRGLGHLVKATRSRWLSSYNHLPKDYRLIEKSISACEECFEYKTFGEKDFPEEN